MPEYRWNVSDFAAGYDAAAEHIHPYYVEVQETILGLLPFSRDEEVVIVDAGGGSGRLAAKLRHRFTKARVIVVDQSEAFLDLARKRLAPWGERAELRLARLQEAGSTRFARPPAAVVSMSAIHHLDGREKQDFYRRVFEVLRPGGVLLNGDEVRPEAEADYLERCRAWAAHMHRMMDAGLVPPPMRQNLHQWEERNVTRFGEPRKSGDDCHETIAAQLGYFRACGFAHVDAPWHQDLWAILRGVKPR